ncbi:hypothetical protein Tco_1245857 [Tanacetum coccineum]
MTNTPTGEHITGDQNVRDSMDMLPTWKILKTSIPKHRIIAVTSLKIIEFLVTNIGRYHSSKSDDKLDKFLRRRLQKTSLEGEAVRRWRFIRGTSEYVRGKGCAHARPIWCVETGMVLERVNCVLRISGLYTLRLLDAACKKVLNLLKKGLLKVEATLKSAWTKKDQIDNFLKERRFYTLAGNPVKEILLKLNLPDHRSILTDSKKLKDGGEDRVYYGLDTSTTIKTNLRETPLKETYKFLGYDDEDEDDDKDFINVIKTMEHGSHHPFKVKTRIDIPTYDVTFDAEKLDSWIDQLETCFTLYGFSSSDNVVFARLKLTSHSLAWWNS